MNYGKYNIKTRDKLKQYGGDVTVKHKTASAYNPTTNSYTDTEETISGYGLLKKTDVRAVNGTSVLADDVFIFCWLSKSPVVGDSIKIGQKEYKVVDVSPCSPDGATDIFYNVQGR